MSKVGVSGLLAALRQSPLAFSLGLLMVCGCNLTKRSSESNAIPQGTSDGQSVLMALRSLTAEQFPEVDFATFQGHGAIGAPLLDVTATLPGRVFDTFSPTLEIQVYPLGTGALRREIFSIKTNQTNSRIVNSGLSVTLTPQLRMGSNIEVVRNFSNSSAAAHAMPFSFMQLPLSAESALALSEGTYVSVPIDGTIAMNVSGNFLAANGSSDQRLYEFLRAGASGSLSGTMQGAVLATGQWRLQILRLSANKVRVRVVEEDKENLSSAVNISGQSVFSYTFVPLGTLSRALDISRRVINNVQFANVLISDAQRLANNPQLLLSPVLKKSRELASHLPVQQSEAQQHLDESLRITDRVIEIAKSKPDTLQAQIDSASFNQLSQIQNQFKTKIDAVSGILQKITNATYRVDASIQLNTEFARRYRFIADYVFDLTSQEAKVAYDHAVSGRSLWLGTRPAGLNPNTGFNNFAVAERLALEDVGRSPARVLRNSLGESRTRSRKISVQFSGPLASTGFSENWKNNTISLRDSQGNTSTWNAALWQFDRDVRLLKTLDSEQFASGVFLPGNQGNQSNQVGNYWFAWKRRVPSSKSGAMQDIFSNVLNFLGPLGFANDMPRLFKGEFAGDKEASLLVFFSRNAMQSLFDEKRVTDDLLWRALGRVAQTFDNTFGLPFNSFGSLPNQYSNSPAAVDACEFVKKNWGGAYCDFFGNEFLTKFKAARRNPDAWQRLKVFEAFYTKGFLANKIGARLLVRYLTEVMALSLGKEALRDVTLQFSVHNTSNTSVFASPVFASHEPPDELQILESLGMMM